MNKNNIINMENSFTLKQTKEQLNKALKENDKLKILLKEADPDASADLITDAEYICINQISKLKDYAKARDLTPDEIKGLETLNKILRMERGVNSRISKTGKAKKLSDDALEKIIRG